MTYTVVPEVLVEDHSRCSKLYNLVDRFLTVSSAMCLECDLYVLCWQFNVHAKGSVKVRYSDHIPAEALIDYLLFYSRESVGVNTVCM